MSITQQAAARASVIERRDIPFISFEERFSMSPRTVPVSGAPAAPPPERPVSRNPHSVATNGVPLPDQLRNFICKPGRAEQPIRPCTHADGHHWNGHGKSAAGHPKERCKHCGQVKNAGSVALVGQKHGVSRDQGVRQCLPGMEHEWRSKGKVEVKCRNCNACQSKAQFTGEIIARRAWKSAPIVLVDAEKFGPCIEGEHHLTRNGRDKARCTKCNRNAPRVEDAA